MKLKYDELLSNFALNCNLRPCREDPAIDHTVMHMKEDDVVLTISSAGCNVLDYLCEGPKKIIAVDMNFAQLHVLEVGSISLCTPQSMFRSSHQIELHQCGHGHLPAQITVVWLPALP